MKLVAGILALIVLFLAVQPAFSFIKASTEQSACADTCCGNEAELPSNEGQPDDPCSDFCNPLLKCGACAASTIEFIGFIIDKPTPEISRHITFAQAVFSQFAPDFWQPPKIA